MKLRIGSRSSPLALRQVEIFVSQLKQKFDFSYEIVKVKTSGDLIQNKPLYDIGGKALFLKELEAELLSKNIDVAIHSLKDVPGEISSEFSLSCFIGREYPLDSFISLKYKSLSDLPDYAKIGTCSPRRIVSIKKLRPDLNIFPLRGNIETRIKKLYTEDLDAIILAEAGLRRMNLWHSDICYPISPEEIIPAIGQGIITAQILSEREDLKEKLSQIKFDYDFELKVERDFLRYLSADCDSPVACYVSNDNGIMKGMFMYAKSFQDKPNIIIENLNRDEFGIGERLAKKISSNTKFDN